MHPTFTALLEMEVARRHTELRSDRVGLPRRVRVPAGRRHHRAHPARLLVLRG